MYILLKDPHNIFWDKSHWTLNKSQQIKKYKNLSIFSNHNGMKLESSNRRKAGKFTDTWKLNKTFLNQWLKEIKREILKIT